MASADDLLTLSRLTDWLGVEWTDLQMTRVLRYEEWLRDEAIIAGGIGPGETPRLFDRHIADSLAFLKLVRSDSASLIDVGSGVGLPGIPIAIARPEMDVTVLDRSERRTSLAARATRILELENVTVLTADAMTVDGIYDCVTFRASLPIDAAVGVYQRLAGSGGVGVFAWSRREEPKSPPPAPVGTIFSLTSEGVDVLSSPAWLLRMERSS